MNSAPTSRGFPYTAAGLGILALLALVPLAEVWRQSPDLRHGWASALLMAYLWWERSTERPTTVPRADHGAAWWIVGLVAAATALPLRLLLTPFPLWTTVLWAYVGLLACLAAAGEWRRAGPAGARWLLSPCILLASALPWPAFFEQSVIYPLREGMASLAAEVCYLVGRPALAVGTTVRLASGWVGIDEACGGIRSLQACVMIGLFFGEWFRFKLLRRGLLLAVGVTAALAGNFGRVLFLAFTAGQAGGQAVERYHDLAAWVALGLSLIVTAAMACRWAGWKFPGVALPGPRQDLPVPAAGGAWLLFCASLLTLGELGTRGWFAQGTRESAQVTQWTAALPEGHRSFVAEPLTESAAEMLQPDGFRAGRWQESGGVNLSAYYVEWRRGQVARSIPFLHNPTVCLPLAGCELAGQLNSFEVAWHGLNIPFQAYRFTRRGEEFWVAFTVWDPSRAVALNNPSDTVSFADWWRSRWREVAQRRAVQQAQMLTLAVGGSQEEPTEALRSRLVVLLRTP